MCNEVWKVWEGRQSVCITLKVQKCKHVFEPHRMQRYGRFSRWPHALFALLGAAALSHTHRSQRGLHSVEAAFTLCLLCFCARLLALSSSLPSQLLPFWRCDKETASAATALRKISLRKRIQLFGAFLSMKICIPERDKLHSWSMTPHPSNQEPSLQDYKALRNYLVHVHLRESPL